MMMKDISNSDNIVDSRDVIKRIEELKDEVEADQVNPPDERDEELVAELEMLKKVAEGGESSPDWRHGETLIRETYFEDYIEELIHDCYSLPKEMESGDWPWRHMSIDYEAAADEAKQDYNTIDWDGVEYLIRA
jgi:hypothetical protein